MNLNLEPFSKFLESQMKVFWYFCFTTWWRFYLFIFLFIFRVNFLNSLSRFTTIFDLFSVVGQSKSWNQIANFCQSVPSDKIKSRIIFLSSGLKKSSSISKWSKYDFISELKFSISFCLEFLSSRLIKFSSVQIITFFASSECKCYQIKRIL